MTVREAFAKAGVPALDDRPIMYEQNCGYCEEYPESDDGGYYWWCGDQVPFVDGRWAVDFAEGGMMMSYEGGQMNLDNLPIEDATCLPKIVMNAIK